MDREEPITREQLLAQKTDYSKLLVHLTRSDNPFTAKQVFSMILDEQILIARNVWCICKDWIAEQEEAYQSRLKVVCFTETPLEQIKTLLKPVKGRLYQPETYGLIFTKDFIRERGGNPVFYLKNELAESVRPLVYNKELPNKMLKLLALTTLCDEGNDWHWEREWRIVGSLKFEYYDIYCGLCPEDNIEYFKSKYPVTFIDPRWDLNQLLAELVKRERYTVNPEDIPF